MGDSHVGLQARLMSQALKLSGAINKSKQSQSLLTKFVKKLGLCSEINYKLLNRKD